jgi:hypothetical protein
MANILFGLLLIWAATIFVYGALIGAVTLKWLGSLLILGMLSMRFVIYKHQNAGEK